MHTERTQLAERASGKMRRAIGRVLDGESPEELERIAAKDQRLARAGLVQLKRGERVFYKHLDELRREDRLARIEAERETTAWLRGRIEAEKIAAQLREKGWNQPNA
jgi:23S rRNA A2030 N6-methylase RlmJ